MPGARFSEAGGVSWVTAPIGWPMFNGLVVEAQAADSAIGDAIEGLAAGGRPWFLWATPDTPPSAARIAAAAGAERFDDRAPWMTASIGSLPALTVPAGVSVDEVHGEAAHREWAATLRACYGFPAAGEEAWTAPGELCCWTGLPWRQWTAHRDGEALGVAMSFDGNGIAGLLGIGTIERARRQGIGRAVTLRPLHESANSVAGFFSTPDGLPLYRGLGFEARGWVTRYLGGSLAGAGGLARARG